MYTIKFYRENNGKEPVRDYLDSLNNNFDRSRLLKISSYMKILTEYGTRAGLPYIKHLKGDLWELRPLRDRIIFCYYKNNTFILPNSFYKSTNKTPKKEIDLAIKRMMQLKKGDGKYE